MSLKSYDYKDLLTTPSRKSWEHIGVRRRAGVVVPLFSIFSSRSVGIGELTDLELLVDWCLKARMSIIQLLPMNDVGYNFRPYDAQSMFALEPMYLCLERLQGVRSADFQEDITRLRRAFSLKEGLRVDYHIKAQKLALLEKMFERFDIDAHPEFGVFTEKNSYWLQDYALFKAIKETQQERAWEEWEEGFKERKKEALGPFKEQYRKRLLFQQWLQWQLYEQFIRVKRYARQKGVLLMGDLPFLVSRDSADVWQHQEYFKLPLLAGAPPDLLYSKGQRWGMPPYDWENIAARGYDYVTEKLEYAQNFYDLYRIDHVVGIFRVWTIKLTEPPENAGLNGVFDPCDETVWESHGRNLLNVMLSSSSMLACAEDLGTVPPCCSKVLKQLGIPGIDVQRWTRDWGKTYAFKTPEQYRDRSLVTIATHDMSGLCAWWSHEAGTVDENLFTRRCLSRHIEFDNVKESLFDLKFSFHGRLRWKKEIKDTVALLKILNIDAPDAKEIVDLYMGSFDEKNQFLSFLGLDEDHGDRCATEFIQAALEKASLSASIFSLQLLQDYLSLGGLFDAKAWDLRINFPGTTNEKNWTLRMPLPLEEMLKLPLNKRISAIHKNTDRT